MLYLMLIKEQNLKLYFEIKVKYNWFNSKLSRLKCNNSLSSLAILNKKLLLVSFIHIERKKKVSQKSIRYQ